MPNVESHLHAVGGAKFITVIDVQSAFHQPPVASQVNSQQTVHAFYVGTIHEIPHYLILSKCKHRTDHRFPLHVDFSLQSRWAVHDVYDLYDLYDLYVLL